MAMDSAGAGAVGSGFGNLLEGERVDFGPENVGETTRFRWCSSITNRLQFKL